MQTIPTGMPNWEPLERAVPVSWLPDFMHMGEHGTIQLYKHRDTRCYLNIDSDSMRFYRYRDGGYVEVSQTTAILDSLGIRNWDIPVSSIALAPARLRAASVLTAFLDFQKNVDNRLTAYRPDELAAVVSALTRVGNGLENFPEMSTAEIDDATCERFLKHEIGLLVSRIGTLLVPRFWLPGDAGSPDSCEHVARLWQAFCVRLAAEAGTEPVYGRPISEPATVSQPSRSFPEHVGSAGVLDVSKWRSRLGFLSRRGPH